MNQPTVANLLDFALALSEILDLASPLIAQHQIRTAYIAWRVGEAHCLPAASLERLILASLLHDIGALTPEEKIRIHEGHPGADLDGHCIHGKRILSGARLFKNIAAIVRFHHTPWEEWERTNADEIMVLSQIVFLADTVERSIKRERFILDQNKEITIAITALSRTSFDPAVVESFKSVAEREEFWLACVSPHLLYSLREYAPRTEVKFRGSDILELSEVTRRITDFRSRFTATHSTGVAYSASLLAKIMGFAGTDIGMIYFAGNLHDIGKLTVPNGILEKRKELTEHEYAIMRQHSYYTGMFVRNCGLPSYLAEWAGFHHERLSGDGYPYHCKKEEISSGARIIAVADVFTALAEDRPYRAGLSRQKSLAIVRRMARAGHLDGEVCNALAKNYDDVVEPTLHHQNRVTEQFAEEMKPSRAGLQTQ